jgi:hypothetical protein
MSIWKGAFAPTLVKHVMSVRYVPAARMSQDDWNVLDYDVLRPSARANLDQAILDGSVEGFFMVDIEMHKASRPHGGKARYFYPALKGQNKNPDPADFQQYSNFDNKVDQDLVDTTPTERLGYLLFMLKTLSPDAQAEVMDRINSDLPPDTEEVDIDMFMGLPARDAALLMAIHLFLIGNSAKARKILAAVDILDDELYALLNDDEPTE